MTLKNAAVSYQPAQPAVQVAGSSATVTAPKPTPKVWLWMRTQDGYVTGAALMALIQLAEHPSIARIIPMLCGGSARLLYRAYLGQAEVDQKKNPTLLHLALAIMASGPQVNDKKGGKTNKLRVGSDIGDLAKLLAVAGDHKAGQIELMDAALCGSTDDPQLMSNYAELLAGVINEIPAQLPPAGVKRVLELMEQAFITDPTEGGTLRNKRRAH